MLGEEETRKTVRLSSGEDLSNFITFYTHGASHSTWPLAFLSPGAESPTDLHMIEPRLNQYLIGNRWEFVPLIARPTQLTIPTLQPLAFSAN